MSEASFDLKTATTISDDSKWNDLGGSVAEVEVHYRMITPFSVDKAVEGSNDVKITGPVYVGNSEMLDRHNELVDMKAIMDAWTNYSKNPVILYNHSKTYGVIGRMTDVKTGTIDGVQVPIGTAIIDGGEKDITRKIRKGFLKAFSIGFIAKAAVKICEDEETCYMKFTKIDWIETSVVDVPASPNALFSVTKSILVGKCDCVGECKCGTQKGCGCGCKGEKAQIQTDVFTTVEEAEARAEELGCEGIHSHKIDGSDGERTVYMPCNTHDAYTDATGDDLETPDTYDEDKYNDDDDKEKMAEIFDNILDRLTDIEDSLPDQTKDGSGDSLNSRLLTSEKSMDTHETDLPIEDKVAEATEEESAPVVDATLNTEVTELSNDTEIVEEKSVEAEAEEEEVPMPKPSEVLMEIGTYMKSLDERLSMIEAKFAPEVEESTDSPDHEALIAEKDAMIADLVAEKEAKIAADAMEAEIQARVDAVLAEKGVAIPSRKSIVNAPVVAKSDVTRFDPQPKVSKGTNGLANWLEMNLSRRA